MNLNSKRIDLPLVCSLANELSDNVFIANRSTDVDVELVETNRSVSTMINRFDIFRREKVQNRSWLIRKMKFDYQ